MTLDSLDHVLSRLSSPLCVQSLNVHHVNLAVQRVIRPRAQRHLMGMVVPSMSVIVRSTMVVFMCA